MAKAKLVSKLNKQDYYNRRKRPELSLNSTPLKQRVEGSLRAKMTGGKFLEDAGA